MRAIVVDRWMEPSELTVQEIDPSPVGRGMLRIGVRAAGCNFFDILMVKGQYQVRPPFPFIPGAEIAGVVAEVGPEVKDFAVGDRVMASPGIGAFAEQAVVPAKAAYRMPDGMSFEAGAAFPIVYPTSYAALEFRAPVAKGDWLLVHAAAGGVGIAAVQIGKALGARVIGTAGGAEKLEIVKRAGAEVAIDYQQERLGRAREGGDRRPRRRHHLRLGRRRRHRRLAQVHRVERQAARHRLRQRPHPGGEAEPRAAEEHLAGRPPLGGAHACTSRRASARRSARCSVSTPRAPSSR